MISVLASSVVDCGLDKKKDYKIDIGCLSTMAWNQDNVSEWRDMSTCEQTCLCFSELAL